MKTQFVVSVEMPNGVSIMDMREYIKEAVRVWCGRDHESSIFNLKKNSVTVELFTTTFRREFKRIELEELEKYRDD